MPTNPTCSIADCAHASIARALCKFHYQQFRRTHAKRGEPLPELPPRARQERVPCTVVACDRPQYARGWCTMHYQRWSAGSPLVRGAYVPKLCTAPTCTRRSVARSLCTLHYQRVRVAEKRANVIAAITSPDWIAIPGLEGWYEARADGAIRRACFGRGNSYAGKLLKGSLSRDGYVKIHIRTDALNAEMLASRLIAMTFHGPPPTSRHQANHKDGVKTNNSAANLEWVTPSENQQHALRNGLHQHSRRDAVASELT